MAMIELDYPISTNRMWRNFKGRMVLSAEGKAYKEAAAWRAKAAGYRVPSEGSIEVSIILHPKMKKNGQASEARVDLDNAIKVCLDSMNKVVYVDDKQVVRIIAEVGSAMRGGGLTVLFREV